MSEPPIARPEERRLREPLVRLPGAPGRRPGRAPAEDDEDDLERRYGLGNIRPIRTRRGKRIPITEDCPARARWLELVRRDPIAARRETLARHAEYWRRRLAELERRHAEAESEWSTALNPLPDEDGEPPRLSPAMLFRLQVRRTLAWRDVCDVRARLEQCEKALEALNA